MEQIIKKDILENFKDKTLSDMAIQLHHEHALARGIAVNVIGLRLEEEYEYYSNLLLKEMSNNIHFEPIRLGIKTAWNIAVILAENLKEKDYPKLKQAFDQWPNSEREDLFS